MNSSSQNTPSKNKIKVGVLRGGPSGEYDVSLATGGNVLKHLMNDPTLVEKYIAHDIFIDREGIWHMSGVPVRPHEAAQRIDVVFNALHGQYGEDGKVQALLDSHGVPYTGSDALASAIGMDKLKAKKVFQKNNIKTPLYLVLEKDDFRRDLSDVHAKALEIFKTFSMPAVVKPASSGSSIGITIVRDFATLEPAIRSAFEHDDIVLIEQFIPGVEATVGVIDGFRGQELYALPAIEIRHNRDFFDYHAKYSAADVLDEKGRQIAAQEIVPGNFTFAEKAELERLAREAHRALGLRHYSRSDFIVTPRRGIYILESNTLPGLTDASLIPKALAAVGASVPDFIDHLLRLAQLS